MGEASIDYADRSKDDRRLVHARLTYADAVHQAGELERSRGFFGDAAALLAEGEPDRSRCVRPDPGHRYYELLLTPKRAEEVRARARSKPLIDGSQTDLLATARHQLALGQAALALRDHRDARVQLDQAVDGLRQAGRIDQIPRGLLARAALFRETGGFPTATRDLDEAVRIATRFKMRLFQCDAHLEYARLVLAEGDKNQVRREVAQARLLVEETGYGRRRPEVEELEAQTVN